MYCSLDKVDIVAEEKDGTRLYVQTDHRTAAEMEGEKDISILFAMIRLLGAARMGASEKQRFRVMYDSDSLPPEFLRQAIAAAGGTLMVGNDVIPYAGPTAEPDKILGASLSSFVDDWARRTKTDVSLETLQRYEKGVGATRLDPEADEPAYWKTVLRLGGLGGEVLRRQVGGQWAVDRKDIASLPVIFQHGQMYVNFMGKAIKFLEAGPEDSVAFMVKAAANKIQGAAKT